MTESVDTDRDRVGLEDDYLHHARVLIDGEEYILERAEPDEPRPNPGWRPPRYGNVTGHTTRVRESDR